MTWWRNNLRRLRWRLGRGWSAADFEERYAKRGDDVWGYRQSPLHRARVDFILSALPAQRFRRVLEVGCAQGFLSERLAARADRLVACDLSVEAVALAREACREFDRAEFHVADIRRGFPGEDFDLCLFSDVLYYLSARETDAVLAETVRKTRQGGLLLIANEWRSGARGLTSPAYSFARLNASALWARDSLRSHAFGEAELSIAVYRRV